MELRDEIDRLTEEEIKDVMTRRTFPNPRVYTVSLPLRTNPWIQYFFGKGTDNVD